MLRLALAGRGSRLALGYVADQRPPSPPPSPRGATSSAPVETGLSAAGATTPHVAPRLATHATPSLTMRKERLRKADGRYLISYRFDGIAAPDDTRDDDENGVIHREPASLGPDAP